MNPLRQHMLNDMQLRGLAPKTQESFLRAVRQLAKHSGKSPDQISEEVLRDYFLYLKNEKKASRNAETLAGEKINDLMADLTADGGGYAMVTLADIFRQLLFRASAAVTQQLAQQPRWLGGQLGMVGVLHTWGRNLAYHPHVQFLVPAGAWDGQVWRYGRSRRFLQHVLPKGFVKVRYYGFFSPGQRPLLR